MNYLTKQITNSYPLPSLHRIKAKLDKIFQKEKPASIVSCSLLSTLKRNYNGQRGKVSSCGFISFPINGQFHL